MRLLVTGGAGFIGTNFVHSAVREHRTVTVLDAPDLARVMADVEDTIRLVRERPLLRPRRVGFAASGRVRRGGAFAAESCRQCTGQSGAVSAHQRHRDLCHPGSGATPRCAAPSPRRLGLDDRARFTESTPYNPATSAMTGADMLVGPGFGHLAYARLNCSTRAVSARREVHSASDHQCAPGGGPSSGAGAVSVTGSRSTTTTARCGGILDRGRIGRTCSDRLEGERDNLDRAARCTVDRDRTTSTTSQTRRPDLRYAIDRPRSPDELC